MGKITFASGGKLAINNNSNLQFLSENTIELSASLQFNYSNTTNEWLFTLSNLNTEQEELLNQGYKIKMQIVRYQSHTSAKRLDRMEMSQRKPTYPSGSDYCNVPTNFAINEYSSSDFTDMNFTEWVNGILQWSYNRYLYSNLLTRKTWIQDYQDNNGFWYDKYAFAIVLDNKVIAETETITLNMHSPQTNEIPIDYVVYDNVIDLYI